MYIEAGPGTTKVSSGTTKVAGIVGIDFLSFPQEATMKIVTVGTSTARKWNIKVCETAVLLKRCLS